MGPDPPHQLVGPDPPPHQRVGPDPPPHQLTVCPPSDRAETIFASESCVARPKASPCLASNVSSSKSALFPCDFAPDFVTDTRQRGEFSVDKHSRHSRPNTPWCCVWGTVAPPHVMSLPPHHHCCAKSLQGEAPCGSAVYGKVDEMSPYAPSPSPTPCPQTLGLPCPQTPPRKTRRTRKNRRHHRQGTSHCSCLEHCFLFSSP